MNGLFIMNDTLRPALLRLRRLCMDVSQWKLFEYSNAKTYSLDEFIELQVWDLGELLLVSW